MITLIDSKRSAIEQVCARFHVSRLSVFGSAVRDDFDPASSDIDFLVEFAPSADPDYARNYHRFRKELELTLGKPIDLVSTRAIQNPYLRRSIEADRVQLYAA